MHCKACDVELSDNETNLKDKDTGEYIDLCLDCLTYDRTYYEYITNQKTMSELLKKGER